MQRQQADRPRAPERKARPQAAPQRERTGPRQYLGEVRGELRKVAWPTRHEVVNSTIIVLIAFRGGLAGFFALLYERLMPGKREAPKARVVAPDLGALEALKSAGSRLEVNGATRSFGSLTAVSSVSLTVETGSITALIGPNGAGKTTLFNLIGGYQPLDSGSVSFDGRRIEKLLPNEIAALGIGRTFQNLQLFDTMSVLENVMCGHHRFAAPEKTNRDIARRALAFVGLKDAESLPPGELAFGHQRLVEIARALALEPRLVLMAEPASGLNDSETERLAELILRIAALGVTILLVEHDMRLVMGIADHVVVMHHGEKIADGAPDHIRLDAQVIGAYLGREHAAA
jgi:preprotein translocase SecE subunit